MSAQYKLCRTLAKFWKTPKVPIFINFPVMETAIGLVIGIGLSAACGFRVFLPMLGFAIAAHVGWVNPTGHLAWIATWPALIALATATLIEIAAYYIPWLDNLLDTITTPLAIAAGIAVTASLTGGMHPLLQWSLAVIAGGGVSGLVQGGTVALRAGSTATTGGLANPIISTLEWIAAALLTLCILLAPLLGIALVALLLIKMVQAIQRRKNQRLQKSVAI